MMGYEIRLAGSNSSNEGRVEVKGNNKVIKSNYLINQLNSNFVMFFSPWRMGSHM